jgi:hypothetical protein
MSRRVCVLSSGTMLRAHPVRHWMNRFEEFTQRSANEVVLPAVGFLGPLYDSVVHPVPQSFPKQNLLPQWIAETREALNNEGVVWAIILVELGFLGNDAVALVDQYRDPSLQQVCMVNPVVQDILHTFISELSELGVDGIVLDVTDAYPNAASPERTGFMVHCFCDYCLKRMKMRGVRDAASIFNREPSPARFVLLDHGESTAHIDPPHEWLINRKTEDLVNAAMARKFVEGEDPETSLSDASRLLTYMRARVETTAEAIRDILVVANSAGKRSAVVLGDYKADLSQMVTLPALLDIGGADEYWLPTAPDKESMPGDWRAIQFLGARSTYYTNAFFEAVEKAAVRMVREGPDVFLRGLLSASKGLMNNHFGAGAAYTAEHLPQFEGFAGVPLNETDHIEIVEQLASAATGEVLPAALLERFRIATPETPS